MLAPILPSRPAFSQPPVFLTARSTCDHGLAEQTCGDRLMTRAYLSNKLRFSTKCHRGFAMEFRDRVTESLFASFENAIVREV